MMQWLEAESINGEAGEVQEGGKTRKLKKHEDD